MTIVAGHHWTDWKHAMVAWAKHHGVKIPPAFNPDSDTCLDPCHALLLSIQQHAGIRLEDGKLGEHTQHLLEALLPGPTPAERFHAQLLWGIGHEAGIGYTQEAADRIAAMSRWGVSTPLETDCSGSLTAAAKKAGLPDPNGLDYRVVGYTGTMLGHLAHISKRDIRPGDFCIFGGGDGDHVAAVLEVHADPILFSHGQEAGPIKITFSSEARYHYGQPVTWLRVPYR